MSYTSSDKYAPLVVEWDQAITEFVPTWNKFANVRADNVHSLQVYADKKPGVLGTWNGTDDITESLAYGSFAEQVVTAQGYADKIELSRRDVQLDSNLVEKKAAELLAAAQKTVESSVYEALEAGIATTTIDNGNGGTTAALGGTFYLADGNDQTNGLSVALSNTAVASARQKLMEWKNYNGDPMGLGMGQLALVVSPANYSKAVEITKSPLLRETTTDASNNIAATGANINVHSMHPYEVVVSPFLTADPNDWFLIETGPQSPLTYWTAGAPHLVIEEDFKNHKTVLSLSMFHKVYINTPPNGIISSAP